MINKNIKRFRNLFKSKATKQAEQLNEVLKTIKRSSTSEYVRMRIIPAKKGGRNKYSIPVEFTLRKV